MLGLVELLSVNVCSRLGTMVLLLFLASDGNPDPCDLSKNPLLFRMGNEHVN